MRRTEREIEAETEGGGGAQRQRQTGGQTTADAVSQVTGVRT